MSVEMHIFRLKKKKKSKIAHLQLNGFFQDIAQYFDRAVTGCCISLCHT